MGENQWTKASKYEDQGSRLSIHASVTQTKDMMHQGSMNTPKN